MLTNIAFAQEAVTCKDLKKLDPQALNNVRQERENFEKRLVAKFINKAADEGKLSNFERDMLLHDAKIEIYERSQAELDQSIKCIREELKEFQERIK